MNSRKLEHGIIVLATGGGELKPSGLYGYGEDDRVMTQMELEAQACGKQPAQDGPDRDDPVRGCHRNEERPYCSRVCCSNAIKNALRLKEIDPDRRGDPLQGRDDLRVPGKVLSAGAASRGALHALRQGAAAGSGRSNGKLTLTCYDPSVMEELTLDTDLLVLSAATVAGQNEELANLLKVPRTLEGFFLEAHMKLRPVDFASDGIYLCGLAHSPKNIRETITQAEAAVAKACTVLSKERMLVGGIVAEVQGEKCAACLTCVRACPYGVPVINAKGEAEIDISKCKGCGTCAAECPAKAIDLMHFTDIQIIEKSGAVTLAEGGCDVV